jgi:O-antigen/teichoic acid export membrane protein
MSLRERTLHGIAWSLVGRIGTQLLQYGVSILMAHMLSPADFGRVGMVLVFTGFASIFIDFGIGAALLERRELTDEQLDAAFSSTLAVGLAMTAVFFAVAPWVSAFYGRPELTNITRVSALGFTLSAVGIVPRVVFQRRMEVKRLAGVDFTGGALACLTGAVLTVSGAGIWAIVGMTLTGSGMNSAIALARCGWRPKRLFHFAPARPLVRMSLHLLAFNVINYWARTLDNLLVGKRLGEAQLGYYTRAYSLMLLPLSQITGVISTGALPAMAQAAQDRPRVLRGYLDAMRMIAFVTFPTMTGLVLVAEPFVRSIYGDKWVPTIPILRILAVVGILQSLTNPTGWIYVTQGRTDRLARWGLGACSAIIAALAFGAWLGSTFTVACAYLIVNLILTPVAIAYAGDLIGLTLPMVLRGIAPSVVATGAMALSVAAVIASLPTTWPPGARLAIAVATGMVSYLIFSHFLRNPAFTEARRFIGTRLTGVRERFG